MFGMKSVLSMNQFWWVERGVDSRRLLGESSLEGGTLHSRVIHGDQYLGTMPFAVEFTLEASRRRVPCAF